MRGRLHWETQYEDRYQPEPKDVRQPAAPLSRALSEPMGWVAERALRDCRSCPRRQECIEQAVGLGTFAEMMCEMALGEGDHNGGMGYGRQVGRRPAGYSQRVILEALAGGEEVTKDQLWQETKLNHQTIRRTLARLIRDGLVEVTVEGRGSTAMRVRRAGG